MASQINAADSPLLFKALGANGIFSLLSGADMALAPERIARIMGITDARVISDLGTMLIFFGAILIFYFFRKRLRKLDAIVISLLDLGWVIGSAVLIVAFPEFLAPLGVGIVIAIALVVLTFFYFQAYALWQLQPGSRAGTKSAGTYSESAGSH